MILGLQLYGPIANSQMELPKLLTEIKKLGIDRIEPCICLDGSFNNPSFWTITQLWDIYPVIKKLGLQIYSCHVGAQSLNNSIEEICQIVDTFAIKQIVVGMPELTEEKLQEASFLYCKIADILSVHEAELLIHNGKPDISAKIQGRTAYEYMVDICLGKVGMQFDTGWCARGGEDPWEFIQRNGHRIKSLHYKDFNMNNDTDIDVCIGSGTLDNEIFMQFARYKGIPQFIDADTYSNVIKDAKKSYDYLMNIGQQRAHTVSYLNIYDTKTRTVKLLNKFDGIIEAPNWIKNENTLIYNKDGKIYKFDIDTKQSIQIDTGIANNCNNDHVLSADSSKIAISSNYKTEDGEGSRIFTTSINGGEAKLITPKAPSYLHGWSPDGKYLTYCGFRKINNKECVDIYSISTDGGEEKRLTTEGFNDGPEYSPDGKHIWFISTKTGLMQIYRMNPDGTEIKQITFDENNNWFAHVSPDGKKVINLSYKKGDLKPNEHLPNMKVSIWLMNYEGKDRVKLMDFFGGQGSLNVNSWSSDSRYFAFVSYDIQK